MQPNGQKTIEISRKTRNFALVNSPDRHSSVSLPARLGGRVAVVLTAALVCIAAAMSSCSYTKHVPKGELLLDNATIEIDRDSAGKEKIDVLELYNFLRQRPNHKVLGFAKLQLGTYSLSGSDTTKWYNRWLRSMGKPPVLYDPDLTELSRRQLRQALINRGYMDAVVTVDTIPRRERKRMNVRYNIHPGTPHYIKSFAIECNDRAIDSLIKADTALTLIHAGNIFDRNVLDEESTRLTQLLRDNGYFAFSKECITFLADTVAGKKGLDLTMSVQPPRMAPEVPVTEAQMTEILLDADSTLRHMPYSVRKVYFVTSYRSDDGMDLNFAGADTVNYKGFDVIYGPDHYIKPDILVEKCLLRPGGQFSAADVERTYENLSQLGILRFVNIEMRPVALADGRVWLDAYILMSRNRKQAVSFELEGTNSEGDLGFGVGLTYQHRNLAKRSELLTAKLRGSYESLSGNFEDLINNRYTEFAGEVSIQFPKFEAPFLSENFKKRSRAHTEFSVSANYQERPEYTRVIAGAAWKYRWSHRNPQGYSTNRTYDFIDINYVYLPHSTLNFLDSIAPSNPLLRYSYEDHFIMRTGYTFYRTNRRIPKAGQGSFTIQPSVTTLRASAETAGNVLYALSSATGQKRRDGVYRVFGIQYAQYVKGEFDWTHVRNFNSRNALAMHVGAGIAYPYGNSKMVPFEKRFYAGGANSVRGWGVRTLGPGSYESQNNVLNFINQCGDIALNLSLEYRFKLFWVFEGALFVDAGNCWTIKGYPTQPGGLFKFDKFYKQIAMSYGAGLRMDFTYFLLRLDLGMKAHDPATGREPWPLVHPNWHRDATFHFAVGYPF